MHLFLLLFATINNDCTRLVLDCTGVFSQFCNSPLFLLHLRFHFAFLRDHLRASRDDFALCISRRRRLQAQKHVIHVTPETRSSARWCSLVPVGEACQVTTTGLKWNLIDNVMNIGALISTSNEFSGEPEVNVSTSAPLLWSMEFGRIKK